MSSKQTTNYKLSQWVKSDKVLMDDFNADNAKIDAAIKQVEDNKADKSTVTSLQTAVSKKAEQTDVSALQTAMSGKGNCRIWTTSYTGNGVFGTGNPTSVTFPTRPAIVFIGERSDREATTMTVFGGQTNAYSRNYNSSFISVTWSGSTMSWISGASAAYQLNEKGTQYDVVALIAL